MFYNELKKANPAIRLATETLFGTRLECSEEDPRCVEFRVYPEGLTARMLVNHSNETRATNPCYQYYYWMSDTFKWKETHLLFDAVWPG